MTPPGGEEGGGPKGPTPFRFVGLGFEIVVPILLGLFLGRWIDLWLETEPWFLLVGVVLGMAAGFFNFFRAVLPAREDPGKGDD